MNVDKRIPSTLERQGNNGYNQNNFEKTYQDERPLRGPKSLVPNSNNLTGKNRDLNFGGRKQISIDENDDTI
jgi:hypothetical protein